MIPSLKNLILTLTNQIPKRFCFVLKICEINETGNINRALGDKGSMPET